MEMVPLFKPFMPKDLPELNNILHSGLLAYGKWGKLFEQKIGDYIGEKRIIATNSFNSAMLIALQIIEAKPGDEIIASPMSCLASNQPFATQNLKVVWADVDPKTGTLSPDSVKSKITSKTKAIFHNHFCGYLGYIDEINQLGKENGILVVDDAIEAFGSEYKGQRIGNVGTDMTIFSFQTVRLPNSIDGGGIAFNNDELYRKSILVRDYGIDRDNFRDNLGEISNTCDINLPGFGATISEINSYIGSLQMEKIEELLEIQRSNANYWFNIIPDKFKDCEFINIRQNTKPNFWIFGLLSSNKIEALKQFRNEGYYSSGIHLPNSHYSVFGIQEFLPGLTEFYSKFVAIPCGWWL
jgi:dTDP-4-amino-4,6-dideoxygalactose transaminase